MLRRAAAAALTLTLGVSAGCGNTETPQSAPGKTPKPFELMEATIEGAHAAYRPGELTSHGLVQMYLDRIEAYDKQGPNINAVITLNSKALEEADALEAGAIVLAKVTLGELGGGDSYGSLYGSTHNPYALDRTVGGSSGGTGASVSANFGMIGIGQEGFSSIRRPAAWNSIVGMRPTAGLVSRSGVWYGWPSAVGSLGPMTRTVEDLAKLLDVMVGYDAEDPVTAHGVGKAPDTYTKFLDKDGLKGARIGVIRESLSSNSDPGSEDFKQVDAAFGKAVEELRAAGAVIVDNVVIPDVMTLLAKRAGPADNDAPLEAYFARNAQDAPFHTHAEMYTPENIAKVSAHKRLGRSRDTTVPPADKYFQYLLAREQLMTNLLKVMADNQLDSIVHKSVEHSPTLIKDGVNPPYVNMKGVIHLNTFLIFVSSMSVPAGFTPEGLPVGITLLGRPYDEPTLIKLGYAYEQATHHRVPPSTTPSLAGRNTATE